MIPRMFALLRQIVLLGLTTLLAAGLMALTGLECLSNYLALTFGFQLMGSDSRPLAQDALFGPWIGALFGHLTFAETSALLLSVIVSAGCFWVVHELAHCLDAIHDLRAVTRGTIIGDKEYYRWEAIKSAVKAVLASTGLVYVFNFALNQYRFRSVAAATGSAVGDAAMNIPSWDHLNSFSQGFVMHLIGLGGLSNIAINLLLAGMLACVLRKIGRRYNAFAEDFHAAVANPEQDGPVVVDESTMAVMPGPARDGIAAPTPVIDLPTAPVPSAPAADSPAASQPTGRAEGFSIRMPVTEPTDPVAEPPRVSQEETFPVIGDSHGREVTLTQALAHWDVYYVDDASGAIWLRDYYEALHAYPDQAA